MVFDEMLGYSVFHITGDLLEFQNFVVRLELRGDKYAVWQLSNKNGF